MRKSQPNLAIKTIKSLLLFILKPTIGCVVLATTSILALFCFMFVYAVVAYFVLVEPPLYPNVEQWNGLHNNGSGGGSSTVNYCTSDDYSDVLAYMDDYFPRFRYNPERGTYHSAQENPVMNIIFFIFGVHDYRSVTIYTVVPDEYMDKCASGTYFVIYESYS